VSSTFDSLRESSELETDLERRECFGLTAECSLQLCKYFQLRISFCFLNILKELNSNLKIIERLFK